MIFYSHYKKIRRERKISLEDISRRTKVDIKYIKLLESGKFSEIPGVYTKLFFKAYINEIGCDVDEALENLENFLNKKGNTNSYDKDDTSIEDKNIFNISFSHLQKSNILVGIIFLSLVFSTILLQNRPDSSIEDKKALLRLTKNDIESIYIANSTESFSEDLQTPINIRFNSLNENYISFMDNGIISSEHFILQDNQSDIILEKWDGEDKSIIIASTIDIELVLFSESEFSQIVDLSYRISNNFPVLINLEDDPVIVSITKYIPKR